MRAAIVDSNKEVVNLIEYDPESDYEPEEHLSLVPIEGGVEVGIGWWFSNGGFTAPEPGSRTPEPTPQPTPEQKRIADLEAAVDQLILDQLMGG